MHNVCIRGAPYESGAAPVSYNATDFVEFGVFALDAALLGRYMSGAASERSLN